MADQKPTIERIDDRTFRLWGVLDEFYPYDELFQNLPDEVWLDMSKVERINSCGVREWVRRVIHTRSSIYYVNCPPVVVDQMSMVPQFLGPYSHVESFSGIFYCDECSDEKEVVFQVGKDIVPGQEVYDEPDEIECSNCGNNMTFAHNSHIFFAFLTNLRKTG